MELKIEKGVPVPTIDGRWGKHARVYDAMGDGDSVLFSTREDADRFSNALRGRASVRGYSLPLRAVEGGFRVWKVKRAPKPNGNAA